MPYETLRFLLNVCTANVIKVYAYLKYKYSTYCYYNNDTKFRFSQKSLCEILGYDPTHNEIQLKIKDILNILIALELIEIHKEYIKTENGVLAPYYILDKVNDDYKECDITSIKRKKNRKSCQKIKVPTQ